VAIVLSTTIATLFLMLNARQQTVVFFRGNSGVPIQSMGFAIVFLLKKHAILKTMVASGQLNRGIVLVTLLDRTVKKPMVVVMWEILILTVIGWFHLGFVKGTIL
jgi:hypothetical protein